MIAFGGFSWALDGAARRVAAVLRSRRRCGRRARCLRRARPPAPAREIRFRDVTVRLSRRQAGARQFDLTIPGGDLARHRRTERRRQDDARQAAVPALRPAVGRDRDRRRRLRALDLASWRARVAARVPGLHPLELPLRDNVAPAARPTR
jgi:hypothetical protein